MTNNINNNAFFEMFSLTHIGVVYVQDSPAVYPYVIFFMLPFPTYYTRIIDIFISCKQLQRHMA